jgi:GTP-binding protein
MPARFIKSVFKPEDLPSEGIPEVAIIGRSNVGKSSLINILAQRKEMAKTSSTPGKTQSLNYYLFDGFHLVDMPGYGYAKSSKEDRIKWSGLIDQYFRSRKELRAVGALIDARHIGLENDKLILEWLSEQEHPWFIILTKIDKVKQQDISAHEKYLKQEFKSAEAVFKTSSKEGKGIQALLRHLSEAALRTRAATSE